MSQVHLIRCDWCKTPFYEKSSLFSSALPTGGLSKMLDGTYGLDYGKHFCSESCREHFISAKRNGEILGRNRYWVDKKKEYLSQCQNGVCRDKPKKQLTTLIRDYENVLFDESISTTGIGNYATPESISEGICSVIERIRKSDPTLATKMECKYHALLKKEQQPLLKILLKQKVMLRKSFSFDNFRLMLFRK
jgi:hypothetical protein